MCSSLMEEVQAHACATFALAHHMPARTSQCMPSFPIASACLTVAEPPLCMAQAFLLICRYAYKWKDNGLKLPTLTAVDIYVARHKSKHTALLGCLTTCNAAGLVSMMYSMPCHAIRAAQAYTHPYTA